MLMKYPHLYEPIQLGKTLFRNRIFSSPMGHYELTAENFPDPEIIAFYEQRAKGGAASVTVGDCIVDTKTGQSHTKQIPLDNPLLMSSFTALATAISRHGAVAAVELNHGGKFSNVVEKIGGKVASPPSTMDSSSVTYGPVDDVSPGGTRIYEMPEEIILKIIEAYGRGAAFAKHCGFGMVTIHGGHGWLLSQFMSPTVNTRKDRWGGSFENRMRLPLAVVETVRKAVGPNFPIEIRLSGDEVFEGGYDLSYGVEIAKQLDGKVDLIHVSAGNHEVPSSYIVTHPNMFLEEGCNVKYAAEIKKHVKTPVATVGALTEPAYMEEIIASGQADIVQLARQLLVDPDFANKVRTGRDDDVHRCISCAFCFSNAFDKHNFRCAINPKMGTFFDSKFEIPSAQKKTVLVAGGGVGGMQAALTASERGHKVILCEKSDRLGGVLNCERDVPFKYRLCAYLDRQARKISRSAIDIRLNTDVTPEYAELLHPDVIIAAVGSTPIIPPVPGIDGTNVKSAADVYANPGCTRKNVVIMGGGLVGLELAIHLGDLGRNVTVVEMLDELNYGGMVIHAIAIDVQLKRLGTKVVLSTKAVEINEKGLVGEGPEGCNIIPADTVVYAVGQLPLWNTANSLRTCAPEFCMIGDCRAPRNIADATLEAYYAARDIGSSY